MSGAASPCLSGRVTNLPIYSVTPFTMLDFPDRTSCIVWLSGCNMRCLYCHNPQLIKSNGQYSTTELMIFLKKRQGLLEGVTFSGGEASIWPGLTRLIQDVKSLGYAVKLDTNGLRPDTIANLLELNVLDYVALDYKAPREKFTHITGVQKYDVFSQTLDLLCEQSKTAVEVRTTVHTDLLDESDVNSIIQDLEARNFQGCYYVQNFRSDDHRPILGQLPPQSRLLNQSALKLSKTFSVGFRNF